MSEPFGRPTTTLVEQIELCGRPCKVGSGVIQGSGRYFKVTFPRKHRWCFWMPELLVIISEVESRNGNQYSVMIDGCSDTLTSVSDEASAWRSVKSLAQAFYG